MNSLIVVVTILHGNDDWFLGVCFSDTLPAPVLKVVIEFTVKNPDGELVRKTVIRMEARNRENGEDCLRDELRQSALADHELWNTYGKMDPNNEWNIEIIDPDEFIKWFGNDQALDLFKNMQQNDKPLRLPASHT